MSARRHYGHRLRSVKQIGCFFPVPTPYAAAAVAFRAPAGRILLLQRAEGILDAGAWNLPGGHPEPGETPAQTARREAWEEAGLRTPRLRWLAVLHPAFVIFAQDVPRELIPALNAESVAAAWVDPQGPLPPMRDNLARLLRAL